MTKVFPLQAFPSLAMAAQRKQIKHLQTEKNMVSNSLKRLQFQKEFQVPDTRTVMTNAEKKYRTAIVCEYVKA